MYCVFYPFFVEYILDACWSTHNVVPMPKSWNIFLHLYVVCISLQYVPFEIYFYIYLIVLYVILNIKLPLVFIKVCIWGSWLFSVFYCKLALHINMIFPFLWTSRKKIFAKQIITDMYISFHLLILFSREKKSQIFFWTTLYMFLQTYQSIIIWIFPCNNCNQISSTLFLCIFRSGSRHIIVEILLLYI